MKVGRPTGNEMNDYCELAHEVLTKKQKGAVAVVIAPFLVSEKQSGYRGQLRTEGCQSVIFSGTCCSLCPQVVGG